MVPERQYHGNGRPAMASRERSVPGTPSRKEKIRESSALQDPGLKDYVRITLPLMSLVPERLGFWMGAGFRKSGG
jgi:hypothetical protein